MNIYRAFVTRIVDSTHAEVRIDLGFRLYAPGVVQHSVGESWARLGWPVIVRIHPGSNQPWTVEFDHNPWARGSPPLWHYQAELIRVVDGDTFDACVHFPTGLQIEERFRLAGVHAEELGNDDGYLAKEYIADYFAQTSGRMTIVTTHSGKWRRWLVTVYISRSETSLNTDVVAVGVAHRVNRRRNTATQVPKRVDLRLARPLYDSLADRASLLKLKPPELAHNIVRDYLEQPPADEPR